MQGRHRRVPCVCRRCPIHRFPRSATPTTTQYRFCPNMIVIDTPGLLSAPAKLRHMNEQQRQLQQAAKEAEHLVLEKMKCQDYLILCVEVRDKRTDGCDDDGDDDVRGVDVCVYKSSHARVPLPDPNRTPRTGSTRPRATS